MPGAEHAGLTVVRGRREVSTPAATAEVVRSGDQVQYSTGQGPCLDAVYQQHTVRLSDMAAERRWPDFSRGALELGVRDGRWSLVEPGEPAAPAGHRVRR